MHALVQPIALALFTALMVGCAANGEKENGKSNGAKSLLNGKDLSGWTLRNKDLADTWVAVKEVKLDPADNKKLIGEGVGGALLRQYVAAHKGSDIYTTAEFGDIELTLEFMVPKGSNSGVYLMGRYEVQVLDSFGKADDKLGQGDVGAIYSAAKPSTNAAKEPGTWQTFQILFHAPRFGEDGTKTANARFLSVKLNGKEIQKDVEVKAPTGGQLYNDEKPAGPILLQGDHGIVAYRNIKVKPIAAK